MDGTTGHASERHQSLVRLSLFESRQALLLLRGLLSSLRSLLTYTPIADTDQVQRAHLRNGERPRRPQGSC